METVPIESIKNMPPRQIFNFISLRIINMRDILGSALPEIEKRRILEVVGEYDEDFWRMIEHSNSIEDYEYFIICCPNSLYVPLALNKIEHFKRREIEKIMYNDCGHNPNKLKKFLQEFPDGEYALKAQKELAEIEEEERCWREAVSSNTVSSYCQYYDNYPNGRHIHELNEKVYFEKVKREVRTGVFCHIDYSPYDTVIKGIRPDKTYSPSVDSTNQGSDEAQAPHYTTFWDKLRHRKTYQVYSSVFAPAEISVFSHMLVQVYLHRYDEIEEVKRFAQESQKNAERRDFAPLRCKLKTGDKVDVILNIYGKTLLMSEKKSVIWQGSFTKCSFDYFISEDINVDGLSCAIILTVNGAMIGEMLFTSKIIENPRDLNTYIISKQYNKIFISYAHEDEEKVRPYAKAYQIENKDYFFDRDYLTIGDIFPKEIEDYINSADLFLLFWSENAAKSEYVQKECHQALQRAFPQIQPAEKAQIRICPMCIEPKAELPENMKNYYQYDTA